MGGKVSHTESAPVVETFRGQTVWQGIVEVFKVEKPPPVLAYGWAVETDSGPDYVAVLGVSPIDSPLAAVRAWIVATGSDAQEGNMSKFIIALDGGTREQRNAVTALLQGKGWKLWHWMEDLWLLSQVPDNITSKQISEELFKNPLIGKKVKIVIQVSDNAPKTYWGDCNPDSWKWMAEFWGKPE